MVTKKKGELKRISCKHIYIAPIYGGVYQVRLLRGYC